ncbi:methyl-CpG-binding domain protein 1a isoform X2 [Xyrauchen texanus]|uniref:methyl-CpG-binding domain protein 1a isoform X2 n=1 Tax=Xyrauchen texanus TaxID=154827 RepID=UPI002242492A|nr:methyl-CpG-binding domain protein 1a isoform X2 [Xyrauchen texanus]
MTEELSRASAEQDETEPVEIVSVILNDVLPVGADFVSADVAHTMENVLSYDVEHTLENDLSDKVTVESLPDWLKPMEEDDVDEGVEMDKTNDVPKVKRRRGRPPRAKNIRKRLLMEGLVKTKGVATIRDRTHSSQSARTATPRPYPTRTPETHQSTSRSQMSTPQRPQLTPISPPEGSAISQTANTEFRSPPRLTRVSPLNVGTTGALNPCHSPVVKVGNVSQQKTISSTTPGKDSTEPPLRLWLCPSMEPISPTKTQETLSDRTVPIVSPNIPEATLNGRKPVKEESFPLLSDCFNCGCPFPAKKAGDMLCPGCTPEKKQSPPNIVFRKKKHPRYIPKKVLKKGFVPDGDDDDDDDDDEFGGGNKKRNRRMCQQCVACLRDIDCGECDFCRDKPKFGGSNKKRQKCRMRQCQFQSKLQYRSSRVERSPSFSRRRKYNKPGRPSKKRKNARHPWDKDYDEDDVITDKEDKVDLRRFKRNGSRSRGRRKWNYSLKEEEEDTFVEAVIGDDDDDDVDDDDDDDDEPDNLEASITLGNERSLVISNDIYLNTCGLNAQSDAFPLVHNEPVKNDIQPPQSQDLYYTMPGLPGTLGEDVIQNGFLQIEMVRVGSPLSQYIEEPQNTAQHVTEPPQEESTPVITQIFSLAESNSDQNQGLLQLLTTLRQTVLPAHWVGVMARGPVLQLLQCSKLSTMADTVVQIDKNFFYQISVQNQPLLLMHPIYTRHPTCLTMVDYVVSLLLDLEGLSVCQGYQNLEPRCHWEPRMSVRSALCDLLIPKDEDQCEKCEQPT